MPAPSSGSGKGLAAMELTAGVDVAGFPVAGSRLISLIPLQYDPRTSHFAPSAALTSALVIQAGLAANTVPAYAQSRRSRDERIWMFPLPMAPAGSPVEKT